MQGPTGVQVSHVLGSDSAFNHVHGYRGVSPIGRVRGNGG